MLYLDGCRRIPRMMHRVPAHRYNLLDGTIVLAVQDYGVGGSRARPYTFDSGPNLAYEITKTRLRRGTEDGNSHALSGTRAEGYTIQQNTKR